MITTMGTLAGQLLSGVLGEVMPLPVVVLLFMFLNALAVLFIMVKNRAAVKNIYNRDV